MSLHNLILRALSSAVACFFGAGVLVAEVPVLKPLVLETYPHDTGAYTQGLFFWNGNLYESTGQNGKSSMRKVDLKTGKILQKTDLDRRYFGEGSAVVGDKLYMLTWTNGEVLVFDPVTFKRKETLNYPREGWGLVALPEKHGIAGIPAGAVMVASDGSANLYFLNDAMVSLKILKVCKEGRPVRYLNELEWVNGKIWANVYTTDMIVVINPGNGVVESMIDCSELIPRAKRTADMDVLNGIAADADGNVYLTGKNWPEIFKITCRR